MTDEHIERAYEIFEHREYLAVAEPDITVTTRDDPPWGFYGFEGRTVSGHIVNVKISIQGNPNTGERPNVIQFSFHVGNTSYGLTVSKVNNMIQLSRLGDVQGESSILVEDFEVDVDV